MEPKPDIRTGPTPILALRKKLSGLAAGTDVVTADGLIPVEHLTAGDRVVTRDGGMQRAIWIESHFVTTFAVRFAADALGHNRPENRLILPEGQRLLIRDWRAKALYGGNVVGVPAWRLADGEFISRVGPRSLYLYRVGFERQHTIYAGGLELLAHTKRSKIS
ncbi:MAG: Hint domain-containing protein [Pseudomonadota bacterium]